MHITNVAGQAYNHKNGGSAKVVILTKELRERDARGTRIYLVSRKSCDVRHMTLPHPTPLRNIARPLSKPQLYTKPKRQL